MKFSKENILKIILNLGNRNITYFFTILLLNFVTYETGKNGLSKNLIWIDNMTHYFISSRIYFLNLSIQESSWIHHSPIIHWAYLFSVFNKNFQNIEFNFYFFQSAYLCLVNLFAFLFANKLVKNKLMSLIFSFTFTMSIRGIILQPRDFGILLLLIIFLNVFQVFKKPNKLRIFLITFFSTTLVLIVESFGISYIVITFTLLFILFRENKKNYILFYLISILFSFLIFLVTYLINNDISNLTYIKFHIYNTVRNSAGYLNSIGVSNFYNLKLFIFSLVIFFSLIIIKNLKFNFSMFIALIFLSELIALFITGPRYTHYRVVLLVPIFAIFLTSFNLIKKILNVKKIIIIYFILINLFIFKFNNFYNFFDFINFFHINNKTSIELFTYSTYEEYENADKILSIISNDFNTPSPILTWVHPIEWSWILIKGNNLPATRYWWYLHMKYDQVEKYNWNLYKDDIKMQKIFIKDIQSEKPKFAIIDKLYNIGGPPSYFQQFLNTKNVIYEDEKFVVYNLDY